MPPEIEREVGVAASVVDHTPPDVPVPLRRHRDRKRLNAEGMREPLGMRADLPRGRTAEHGLLTGGEGSRAAMWSALAQAMAKIFGRRKSLPIPANSEGRRLVAWALDRVLSQVPAIIIALAILVAALNGAATPILRLAR